MDNRQTARNTVGQQATNVFALFFRRCRQLRANTNRLSAGKQTGNKRTCPVASHYCWTTNSKRRCIALSPLQTTTDKYKSSFCWKTDRQQAYLRLDVLPLWMTTDRQFVSLNYSLGVSNGPDCAIAAAGSKWGGTGRSHCVQSAASNLVTFRSAERGRIAWWRIMRR